MSNNLAEVLPMRKYTLRLHPRDVKILKQFYPEVGYNYVIRAIVHRHAVNLENKLAERLSRKEIENGGQESPA